MSMKLGWIRAHQPEAKLRGTKLQQPSPAKYYFMYYIIIIFPGQWCRTSKLSSGESFEPSNYEASQNCSNYEAKPDCTARKSCNYASCSDPWSPQSPYMEYLFGAFTSNPSSQWQLNSSNPPPPLVWRGAYFYGSSQNLPRGVTRLLYIYISGCNLTSGCDQSLFSGTSATLGRSSFFLKSTTIVALVRDR